MPRAPAAVRPVVAWSLVLRDRFLHTNWLLGQGVEAWPGMLEVGLFRTRRHARFALERLRKELPFPARVVRVTVTERSAR